MSKQAERFGVNRPSKDNHSSKIPSASPVTSYIRYRVRYINKYINK
jgi:hypothetical protein